MLKFNELYRMDFPTFSAANSPFVTGATALGNNKWIFWTDLPNVGDDGASQPTSEMQLVDMKPYEKGGVEAVDAVSGLVVRFLPLTSGYVSARPDEYALSPAGVEFVQNDANFRLHFQSAVSDEYLARYSDDEAA